MCGRGTPTLSSLELLRDDELTGTQIWWAERSLVLISRLVAIVSANIGVGSCVYLCRTTPVRVHCRNHPVEKRNDQVARACTTYVGVAATDRLEKVSKCAQDRTLAVAVAGVR